MAKKEEKTNVCRLLEQKKIPYEHHYLDTAEGKSGAEIAAVLGEDPSQAFKTLVTVGKSKSHYVFVIPVNAELDLKKAAAAAGEKSIEMLKQKDLLPLTGYVHGGCSPIGMKKFFPTVIHSSALQYEHIFFSAGKVGHQVKISVEDISKMIEVRYQDVIVKR